MAYVLDKNKYLEVISDGSDLTDHDSPVYFKNIRDGSVCLSEDAFKDEAVRTVSEYKNALGLLQKKFSFAGMSVYYDTYKTNGNMFRNASILGFLQIIMALFRLLTK